MEASHTRTRTWTVARLLAWTRAYFKQCGVESPRLCAELLLAHALRCERIHLYTRYESTPDEAALAVFRAHVKEAAAGRPIAYLTGQKEFFSLAFEVGPEVLIPRPETEVLVERSIELARRAAPPLRDILDLGTGSGCIAVALAVHLPEVRLFASDVSAAALAVAQRNAERHKVAGRIEFRAGDLFAPWREGAPGEARRFDVIVSNPPYVATADAARLPRNVRDFEPHAALFAGADGLDLLRRLAAEAGEWLRPGGHLLVEVACGQSARVQALLRQAGFSDVHAYRDGAGIERVLHARRRAAMKVEVA